MGGPSKRRSRDKGKKYLELDKGASLSLLSLKSQWRRHIGPLITTSHSLASFLFKERKSFRASLEAKKKRPTTSSVCQCSPSYPLSCRNLTMTRPQRRISWFCRCISLVVRSSASVQFSVRSHCRVSLVTISISSV